MHAIVAVFYGGGVTDRWRKRKLVPYRSNGPDARTRFVSIPVRRECFASGAFAAARSNDTLDKSQRKRLKRKSTELYSRLDQMPTAFDVSRRVGHTTPPHLVPLKSIDQLSTLNAQQLRQKEKEEKRANPRIRGTKFALH